MQIRGVADRDHCQLGRSRAEAEIILRPGGDNVGAVVQGNAGGAVRRMGGVAQYVSATIVKDDVGDRVAARAAPGPTI